MKLNLCTLWRKHRWPDSPPQMTMDGTLREFKYEELDKATKGFSEDLGSGCFRCYRGMLPDSTSVAVKIVPVPVEFLGSKGSFLSIMKKFGRHINLLPLIGVCWNRSESKSFSVMLVCEYMPRRSLDLHLFQQQPKEEEEEEYQNYSLDQLVLDWNRRYQIALGTARALAFIDLEAPLMNSIEGNIKPENMILDSDFCPKLTDFYYGLLFRDEFDENPWILSNSTSRSYFAPEALSQKRTMFDHRSLVYSYGMVLFEMISGIRNSENGETPTSFPTRVASVIRAGGDDILSVLDKRLARDADGEEVLRVCKLACWCIHDDPEQRPSIKQVVDVLEGVINDYTSFFGHGPSMELVCKCPGRGY